MPSQTWEGGIRIGNKLGFDTIVVGGGAAGCVLAARIAETKAAVLLLEAGPDLRADLAHHLGSGEG